MQCRLYLYKSVHCSLNMNCQSVPPGVLVSPEGFCYVGHETPQHQLVGSMGQEKNITKKYKISNNTT